MNSYILSPRAGQDLDDICEFIARDSLQAASRVLSAIEKAIQSIAQSPGVGHFREELADRQFRFLLVYSYLIVYRPETKPLQVVRILHGARDIQSILRLASDPS